MLRRAGARRDADRLDRRQRRRRGGDGGARERVPAPPARRASTTTRSSTTGPGGRRWSCATASTPASSGRRSSCRSGATATATTCCCSPAPSPTWRGTASPTTVVDLAERARRRAGWSASAPTRSPRRTPGRRACRCTSPSAEVLAERAVPHAARSTCPPAWPPRSSTPLHGRGIPALGLWAQVPHYVATMSYPAASVALLDGLAEVDRHHRRRRPSCAREAIASSASGSTSSSPATPSTWRWSRQLERALRRRRGETAERDAAADGPGLELRSGDELAAELERFLRDQGKS